MLSLRTEENIKQFLETKIMLPSIFLAGKDIVIDDAIFSLGFYSVLFLLFGLILKKEKYKKSIQKSLLTIKIELGSFSQK